MDEIMLTITVALLFVIRIGIPVVVLVTLGVLMDHWYSRDHVNR